MDHLTSQIAETVIGHQETEIAAHTPTPWKFIDATKEASMQYRPVCVIRSGEKQIASFSWNNNSPWFPTKSESQANAAFIVKAVNAYTTDTALLDQAWEAINALGGTGSTPEELAFVYAIERALNEIEALGGMDPKQRNPKAA